MALGSGSSSATERCTRRGGLPSSLQPCKEGRAVRLHQVSSSKPTTQPLWRPTRSISRSRRLFSSILGIGARDPVLGTLPTHPQLPRQGSPDGLATYSLVGEALLQARLGGHLQGPKAARFAELPGATVQHLL